MYNDKHFLFHGNNTFSCSNGDVKAHWLTNFKASTKRWPNARVMVYTNAYQETTTTNVDEYCCFISCFLYALIRFRAKKRLQNVKETRLNVLKLLQPMLLIDDVLKIVAEYYVDI